MTTDAEITKVNRALKSVEKLITAIEKKDLVQELRKRNPFLDDGEDVDEYYNYNGYNIACDELEKMQKEMKE